MLSHLWRMPTNLTDASRGSLDVTAALNWCDSNIFCSSVDNPKTCNPKMSISRYFTDFRSRKPLQQKRGAYGGELVNP